MSTTIPEVSQVNGMSTKPAERPHAPRTLVGVLIFSASVLAIAWVASLFGGTPASPGAGLFVWAVAPLVVALLVRASTRDWRDLGVRPKLRGNARWYLVSFLAFPVLMVLTLAVTSLTGSAILTGFSPGPYLATALISWPIFFLTAVFEEVGWRGYLTPKLSSLGLNVVVVSGLTALVWTAWHLPFLGSLAWVDSTENLLVFAPRFFVLMFALSILYTVIRTATGTFWPAVVLHATSNAFGHPFVAAYVRVEPGQEYLGSTTNGLFMIGFALALGIAVWLWSRRNRAVLPARTLTRGSR
jgi:membrane protease YdiL (CAAX protease family)